MLINFKEIPQANLGSGEQDTFEKFARDFLTAIGYFIIEEPTRGADGGIDIKVLEKRKGIGGETDFYWLVSCKHNAHSGSSVNPTIENNIYDRVKSNQCNGFIGFYSTIASSGLKNTLEGLKAQNIAYQLYDNEKIENQIIGNVNLEKLFLRYFPNSYKKWKELYFYYEPIKLFEFYIDQKHSDLKDFLKNIYGSTENAIKNIRKHNNFKSSLSETDKTSVEYDLIPSKILEDPGYIFITTWTALGINDISLEYLSFYTTGLNNESAACIIYNNSIILNKNYIKHLDNIYLELHQILQ